MDVFSSEGELVHIHTAFHQCLYQNVIDFNTTNFSKSNILAAHLLKLRSQIALQQYGQVIDEVKKANNSANEYKAVAISARYFKAREATGEEAAAKEVKAATELSLLEKTNANVQILCSTVIAAAGDFDLALKNLTPLRTNIDVVALVIQLHLLQHRLDLAKEELEKAKEWAQDGPIINLAESWVYLREGGDKYQSAYYVFEELASTSETKSVNVLIGQAVSELHLGRLDEAELALNDASQLENSDHNVKTFIQANRFVLNRLAGKPLGDELSEIDPTFELVRDLADKKAEFATLLEQYEPVFVPVS